MALSGNSLAQERDLLYETEFSTQDRQAYDPNKQEVTTEGMMNLPLAGILRVGAENLCGWKLNGTGRQLA